MSQRSQRLANRRRTQHGLPFAEMMTFVGEVLADINEQPCVECGETGDTLPCLECDKLICGDCGDGIRWCKEHAP